MTQTDTTLARYKALARDFTTADFGTREPFPMGQYGTPAVHPNPSHPRMWFTNAHIDKIRANLTHPENATAYRQYLQYSETETTGILPAVDETRRHNMNYGLANIIEAKAFRYAMTGEAVYGYQAIYAIKNMMLTLDIPKGSMGDACRAWGYVMYVAGCVYDWCYGLLTEECKTQIINGCVVLLGPHFEIGVPPAGQGPVYGHGAESQLLRDWLSIAIAAYEEAPDLYDFVAGRILTDYVEANDYLQQSWNHWEGSMYGPARFVCQLYAQIFLNRMLDGQFFAFSDDMRQVMYTLIHYIRPDSQVLRIGDVWNQDRTVFYTHHYGLAAFYTGNLYQDPVLRQFAYENLKQFSYFSNGEYALSPVMQLAMNDPSIGMSDHRAIPTSRVTKDPLVSIFARTTWDGEDREAAMVYMTMPRSYAPSHAHMDCGSFQIYYKGILASDSGKYSSWGDAHHFGYTMQTVSANSILVYNPAMLHASKYFAYSGGQSGSDGRSKRPSTLAAMLREPEQFQCTTLGAAAADGTHGYQYAYLAGDMTAAYDPETVEEVTRYILSATTENGEYPLVLATFDRITAVDAAFRKSALIHCEEEPQVTEDGFVIVRNTRYENSGKLVIQSALTETEVTLIGGEGKRFWLHDANADTNDAVVENSLAEYGWGRIEISPAQAHKTDHLLTVMYVTDAANGSAPIPAKTVASDALAGAQLLGRAMLFPKEEKLLRQAAAFTLAEDGDCYIGGVTAGAWTVTTGTETKRIQVREGENLLTFTAHAGEITLTPEA